MTNNKVIFITGSGRSGTNIFKEILSKNSQVATLPFEHRFTVDPRGLLDFYHTFPSYWTPYWADWKIKDLESFLLSLASKDNQTAQEELKNDLTPLPYSGWELNKWIPGYENLVNELISSLIKFRYSARWPGSKAGVENNHMYFSTNLTPTELCPPIIKFLSACVNAICADQSKDVFVEDNTHSMLFAESLYQIAPDGKMAHIIRDPRDVIASLINQRWAPNDLEHCIMWYQEVLQTWLGQRKILTKDFYTEIRFEDLVNDTKSVLENFAAFSGIEVQETMLQIDLSKNNIGRHKTQFNSAEKALLNSRLKEVLSEYNYD